ncbi:MAG: hypothetical protein J6I73_00300 [Treponema sp.]|nr:hypothetical protein [Treponema sp.]
MTDKQNAIHKKQYTKKTAFVQRFLQKLINKLYFVFHTASDTFNSSMLLYPFILGAVAIRRLSFIASIMTSLGFSIFNKNRIPFSRVAPEYSLRHDLPFRWKSYKNQNQAAASLHQEAECSQ